MARSKNSDDQGSPASSGHNGPPLTEDEAGALVTYHALKIIELQRAADQKKAEYDGARSAVNGQFKLVSRELQITRKEFEANVLAALGMTDAEYRHAEARRSRLHRLAGLKQGDQIDLLDHVLADTVDEAIGAEADGYRAGRRADDPVPPKEVSPILHQDWLRGYHAGQEFNGLQLGKAEAIRKRPKPGEMAAEPEDAAAEEDDASPEAIKRKASGLKDAGWTEPTPAEAEFAGA